MSLPKKRHGFRKIVVDGVDYDWRLTEAGSIDIRIHKEPRRKVIVDIDWESSWLRNLKNPFDYGFHPCSSPVSPKFVAMAIKESVLLGWQRKFDCSLFNILYQDGRFLLKSCL